MYTYVSSSESSSISSTSASYSSTTVIDLRFDNVDRMYELLLFWLCVFMRWIGIIYVLGIQLWCAGVIFRVVLHLLGIYVVQLCVEQLQQNLIFWFSHGTRVCLYCMLSCFLLWIWWSVFLSFPSFGQRLLLNSFFNCIYKDVCICDDGFSECSWIVMDFWWCHGICTLKSIGW